MGKKILVTGGAGYIGSVMVEQLLKRGDEVLVFDNLYMGHKDAVHQDAEFVEGELSNKVEIDKAIKDFKPEGIMHFASNTLVGESMDQPFMYVGDNVTNALNLLHSAVDHGVRKFILSSTANLFDEPEKIPIEETEKIVPGSPYGESKYMIERILFWLEKVYGLKYAALRYFNAAGATSVRGESHDPETHLIPLVLQVALGQRKKITIFGDDYPTKDGTCVRDYIHILDLAKAHILALDALDKGSRTYNLGSGTGYSVKEVIDTAREITGHPIPAEIGKRRPGDPAVLIAGSEKIRTELGWEPDFGLKDIIKSAWEWHQTHTEGYSS